MYKCTEAVRRMHRLVDLSLVATMCVTERSRYIKDYMTQMHGVMSHESLFSDTPIDGNLRSDDPS